MATRRRRVLVVCKKDAYQQYLQELRNPHLLRLFRQAHPDVVEMQRSHRNHLATIATVLNALKRLPVEFDLAYRTNLRVRRRYDLVICVGGDGTFLQAARSIQRTPILGVNSDPARSEAVFCAATRHTFAALCRRALDGRLPELRLVRLALSLNGRRLSDRAINDVLIAHDDPATMSRYRLRIGSREELQKSSGLWVATAAGSSSAVLAAGGVRLRWAAQAFQYRPRELYRGRLSRYRLTGGVLPRRARVRVTWLMRRGSAFVDGPHVRLPLRFADRLEVTLSLTDPVRVLGLRPNQNGLQH